MTGPDATLLERASDAALRSDWRQAYELLREADAAGLLGAADLPRLADAAYAAGHLDVTIEVWERAHAAGVRTGDRVAAAGAAARVAMHLLFDTALMAPVRGWLLRAERLLDGLEETPVHAWIAVLRSYERLLVGDLGGARAWAARATDIGSRCEPAAAAIGRVAEARSLILQGEVQRGVALLDEAGVAAVSGELDSLSTGVVYCELVCALQGLAQFDLAQQWTEAMERWRPAGAVGSVHGRCRVHRAEILRLRGACEEAEAEALLACDELRPYLRRELGWPLNELGRIRLMRGNIDGAEEAYLEAHEAGWDPQPGLALVRLARGDSTLAAESIRDALERPSSAPSKELPPNTELRRAPLLEAQVEIEIAAGNLDRARSAADELQQVADKFESKALGACAVLARGRLRLAEGDAAHAQPSFEMAARLWHDVGAPYETALARIGLGEALRAQGNERRAALELHAAHAMLERIGAIHRGDSVGRTDRTTRDPVDEQRSETSSASHHTFRRDGDYWSLTFDGKKVLFRDYKGMHYLARLLREPGRELHVLDLVALESGCAAPGSGPEPERLQPGRDDAGEMLDARAKAAYRRRLAEIEEDLAQAQAMDDAGRTAQAHAEHEFLARELSRAVGLGGRDRSAGSASERARASVTRAIRQAMTRIRQQHPSLGRHLERTIRTGTYCTYLADPREAAGWSF